MLDHLKIAEKFGIKKKITGHKHNTVDSEEDKVEIPIENLLNLTKNIGVREH
jgi:hypothetical protein